MDYLHSVVIVDIHLVFDIKINEDNEYKEKYDWNLKSKEGYQ